MQHLSAGPDAIVSARQQELSLAEDGEQLLASLTGLSVQLTAATDQLGTAAKQDITEALGEALSVQRLSARALFIIVALSFLTSVLIGWSMIATSALSSVSTPRSASRISTWLSMTRIFISAAPFSHPEDTSGLRPTHAAPMPARKGFRLPRNSFAAPR